MLRMEKKFACKENQISVISNSNCFDKKKTLIAYKITLIYQEEMSTFYF